MVRAEKTLLLLLSRRKSQFHVREKVTTTTAGPVTAITFHDLPSHLHYHSPPLPLQISALRHILDRFRFAKSLLSDAGLRLSSDPCMFGKFPLVSFRSAEGREEEDSGRQVRVG